MLVAQGSRITELNDVHLRHCAWNLGTAQTKTFAGGRNRLRIVLERSSKKVAGQAHFRVVDAAGQQTGVTTRV